MKKITTLTVLIAVLFGQAVAQTTEEMTAEKTAKESELATLEADLKALTGKVDGLKGDIATLTEKLTPYPRWDVGALGTVGLNFTGFSNWLAQNNTTSSTIGFALNARANMQEEKYFWRNGGNLNLSWLKFDDPDADQATDPDYQVAADAFNLTSLFGYKFTEKFAASALGEYRTSILEERFNDPGYLDLGVGGTWTPIEALVVVFHPLNYNFVFADGESTFESSLGTKIVADYAQNLTKGISWKSNLSMFLSYKDLSNLSNWTWVNSFTTAYKGIGIGFEFGLRNNKQEIFQLDDTKSANIDIDDYDDNEIQAYYVLGLSYSIAK